MFKTPRALCLFVRGGKFVFFCQLIEIVQKNSFFPGIIHYFVYFFECSEFWPLPAVNFGTVGIMYVEKLAISLGFLKEF